MWKYGENHLLSTDLLGSLEDSKLDIEDHNHELDISDGIISKNTIIDGYISTGKHSSMSHIINSYPKNAVHRLQEDSGILLGVTPDMSFVPELRTFEHQEVDSHLSFRVKNEWIYSGKYFDIDGNALSMDDGLFYYHNGYIICLGYPTSHGTITLQRYAYEDTKSIFKIPEFPYTNLVSGATDIEDEMNGLIYVDDNITEFTITSYDTVPLLSFLPSGTKMDLNEIEIKEQ